MRFGLLSPSLSGRSDRLFIGLGLDRLPEVGMLAHPIAVAADIDQVAVMQDAIDQGCGHDIVSQDLAPFLEALV